GSVTEIFIDNSEQDGGDSFHDLTVLWNQRNTFANTVADMIAAAAAVDEFKIVRDRAAGGEWYPAGTKGTPSLIPAAGGTEVFCGTTWQETADGRVSAPTLSVHVGSQAFEPEQALKFAVQLIQEAGRAMRIRALVQEQAQQGGAA
ncbi:hypothetical protein, partial [Rhodococcus sp. MEB064]|uniref:hypothetical protein n=1 Tax=Rhodococcus sp. MEB064 TaxID=1587522 RepID=UPI0005AC0266